MTNSSDDLRRTDIIHWQRTAAAKPEATTLQGNVEVDFAVVGGGLTGCRTALGLAEAGARVAVLDGREIGWGASGRSGGQCNPIWRATPDELAQRFGAAPAERLIDATLGSADALFADITKYQITCDHEQHGWVQAAHCKSARRSLERLAAAWQAVDAKISVLDRAETQAVTGSAAYGFSLFHAKGGHVQPLSLTRGFARVAQGFGAVLYENSPVISLKKHGQKWQLKTPGGTVLASQVILTTNAFSKGLWPGLHQTYFPMVSIAIATTPLSKAQQAEVLPKLATISDSRRAIYFARYDRDRRLIFGCVGSTDNAAALGGLGRLTTGLTTVFPQLKGIGIETSWAGRIAVTTEMMPRLHEPAPGVLAALGFSGRGIAMTSVMARTLVKKALGGADDALAFPITQIKPIPFHKATCAVLPLGAPAMSLRDKLDTIIDPT